MPSCTGCIPNPLLPLLHSQSVLKPILQMCINYKSIGQNYKTSLAISSKKESIWSLFIHFILFFILLNRKNIILICQRENSKSYAKEQFALRTEEI